VGDVGLLPSSSLDELLFREAESRWSGRCEVPGVPIITEFRSCFDGDHASGLGVLVGEFRRFAKRVISAGIAEIVLRSPTVRSLYVLSSMLGVTSVSFSAIEGVVGF